MPSGHLRRVQQFYREGLCQLKQGLTKSQVLLCRREVYQMFDQTMVRVGPGFAEWGCLHPTGDYFLHLVLRGSACARWGLLAIPASSRAEMVPASWWRGVF